MEALSHNSLFEIAKNLNYDTLADLCQSNRQWFQACKNDPQLQKLVESRKLEQKLLNQLANGSSFKYILTDQREFHKHHFIQFAKYFHAEGYNISETFPGYPDQISILNRLFPPYELANSSLMEFKVVSTGLITLEKVRLVLRFLIESPRFNPNNLEDDY